MSISPIYDSVIILWDRISVFLESLTPPFLYFSSSCLSSWFSFSNEMTELCFYLCNSLILFYKIYIFLTNSYFSCWFYNILPESTGLVVFWITFIGIRPFTGLWAYGITLVRELEGLIRWRAGDFDLEWLSPVIIRLLLITTILELIGEQFLHYFSGVLCFEVMALCWLAILDVDIGF